MLRNNPKDIKETLKTRVKYAVMILLVLFVYSLTRNGFKIYRSRSGVDDARERVETLKEEQRRLRSDLEGVQSEIYVEKQIRDKLQFAKREEIVIVLPDPNLLRHLSPAREVEEEILPEPTWRKWMNLFI